MGEEIEEIPFVIVDTQYRNAKERRSDGVYDVVYRIDTYNDSTITEKIDTELKKKSKVDELEARIIELEKL